MARFRAPALVGILSAGAVIAIGAAHCASPTQIIVDIRADTSLCSTLLTGVAVGPVAQIDDEKLEIYEKGCKPDSDQVGTLTITPSGSDDDWVGIRVVGEVNGNPDRCGRPGPDSKPVWTDCVLARRRVQFSPGNTVNLTVRLTGECVGRYCGGDLECNLGLCVQPSQVQPDGGNTPPQKDGDLPIDDVVVPDAPPDRTVPDAEVDDACALCTGAGTSCNAGTCTYDCTQADCADKTLCAPGLECRIECTEGGRCKNTRCATDRGCTFDCTGNDRRRCDNIACAAAACAVNCRDAVETCNGVHVDGGSNSVRCFPVNDRVTCNDVHCSGGTCERLCSDAGCGPVTSCSGACAAWEDGGP